ncbi:MAG: rRNA maturation RNase YbeY [Bacteroidota bacterium]
MASKSKVCFFFDNVKVSLKKRSELKRFIEIIFKMEKKKLAGLNYIFCSDKRLLEINRQFLAHDYYTDIVTFDFSENRKEIAGEIYISIDRVKSNARQFKVPVVSELHRVIFHGALHLCGYKDKNQAEKLKMTGKENLYLTKYFSVVPRDTVSG